MAASSQAPANLGKRQCQNKHRKTVARGHCLKAKSAQLEADPYEIRTGSTRSHRWLLSVPLRASPRISIISKGLLSYLGYNLFPSSYLGYQPNRFSYLGYNTHPRSYLGYQLCIVSYLGYLLLSRLQPSLGYSFIRKLWVNSVHSLSIKFVKSLLIVFDTVSSDWLVMVPVVHLTGLQTPSDCQCLIEEIRRWFFLENLRLMYSLLSRKRVNSLTWSLGNIIYRQPDRQTHTRGKKPRRQV